MLWLQKIGVLVCCALLKLPIAPYGEVALKELLEEWCSIDVCVWLAVTILYSH